jgi:predicted GIY-YIG superfamily endonuclease
MLASQARQFGRTINLFLVDGSPNGVIIAEIGVSTTKAVMASRTSLPQLLARDEVGRTGVYLLVGADPEQSSRDLVYVGEGDQVKTRLVQHDKDEGKDFFTKVVVLISKDDNLTKAHGRYIESRLIAALRKAGRVTLANGTSPDSSGLPEPQIANMERMLEEIEILLPVLERVIN